MAGGKNYSAIAKQSIILPGSNQGRQPRILVYGRNKKGKSTFGNSAPSVLWIDPDDNPPPYRVPRWPVRRWEDLNDIYLFLRSGSHEYKWLNIDGLTKIYHYALKWIMRQREEQNLDKRPDLRKIQHYGQANAVFETMLDNFHSLRHMGIVFTAQEKGIGVTEVDDTSDDEDHTPTSYQFIVNLPKGARAPINAMVDLTGRIYVVRANGDPFTRRIKIDGEWTTEEYMKQRRLLIGIDDMYETGYRSEFTLPDVIEDPTVRRVVRALRTGEIK